MFRPTIRIAHLPPSPGPPVVAGARDAVRVKRAIPLPSNLKPGVSALFRYIETLHGDRAWGSMLDSGTGVKSLQWIETLPTDSWTAITAAPSMVDATREALGEKIRPQDRLLVGNWIDANLLAGETFDTVLVDYLVGAIEGFAPYWQDRAFERLRPLVAAGGRLYVIGLEPYVQYQPKTDSGRIVWEIGRVRDACLLLAGERPYREYPLSNGYSDSSVRRVSGRWRVATSRSATVRDTSTASSICAAIDSNASARRNSAARCAGTSTSCSPERWRSTNAKAGSGTAATT